MADSFFANNRLKMDNYMADGSVLLLFAGFAPVKRGDERYPFSPDRNFYYMTGIERENCIFLMGKKEDAARTVLYIERDNGPMAKWTGANLTEREAYESSDIEEIKYLDEFEVDFSAYLFKNEINTLYLDLERRDLKSAATQAQAFAAEISQKFPAMKLIDIYPVFSALRRKKEPLEIERIRKAIAITADGVREMMRHARPGMMEYEIEAYFDYVLKKNGVKQLAFQSIAACGKNGTILHYTDNNQRTEDGDLILFDVGAQYEWYNGDISRTFPVNGRFTKRQREIYEIVLSGQKKVMDAIKPGVPFRQLNEILKDHYFMELQKIGLVSCREEVARYYFHSVSHYLGAETHDAGSYDVLLEEGMVLTVEPGLYIEEYGIGIRIEDDILVTKDGYENLSEGLPKTVEDIEAFMAGV